MINKMSPGSGRMLKENGEYVNIADLQKKALAGKGFEFISDTAEHVAPEGMVYIALQGRRRCCNCFLRNRTRRTNNREYFYRRVITCG